MTDAGASGVVLGSRLLTVLIEDLNVILRPGEFCFQYMGFGFVRFGSVFGGWMGLSGFCEHDGDGQ